MADLVTTTPSQNGASSNPNQGQMTKSNKKPKGSISSLPKEVFTSIETVDSKLGAEFSIELLQAIALKAGELQSIASKAEQLEFAVTMASEKAANIGAKTGHQKAEKKIQEMRIAEIRQKAESFMEQFAAFFDGLLLMMPFDDARKHILEAAAAHHIKIDVVKVGEDSWEATDWEFTLESQTGE